jgi:hypothetical protein
MRRSLKTSSGTGSKRARKTRFALEEQEAQVCACKKGKPAGKRK